MHIDKEQILQLLRDRGQQAHVDQAQQALPDKVDTEEHAGLLSNFGLDPHEVIQRLTGGLGNRL
jgi:hypothetical protein